MKVSKKGWPTANIQQRLWNAFPSVLYGTNGQIKRFVDSGTKEQQKAVRDYYRHLLANGIINDHTWQLITEDYRLPPMSAIEQKQAAMYIIVAACESLTSEIESGLNLMAIGNAQYMLDFLCKALAGESTRPVFIPMLSNLLK